jgi:hypothetical protein
VGQFGTGLRGRASLLPFAIGAGLVAIGAMLPVMLSRPPNLNTGMACFYVGVTTGTIATFVSFFGVLAEQYRSTAWHLYWGKPIFHTFGLLLFWLSTAWRGIRAAGATQAGCETHRQLTDEISPFTHQPPPEGAHHESRLGVK